MKIKRFFAPDIRRAIRLVRDELGAEAVILSNRNVDGGTEIVAARDFDEEIIQQKLDASSKDSGQIESGRQNPQNDSGANIGSRRVGDPTPHHAQVNKAVDDESVKTVSAKKNCAKRRVDDGLKENPVSIKKTPRSSDKRNSPKRNLSQSMEPILSEVRKEFGQLKKMLDLRLSDLTWSESSNASTGTQEFSQKLLDLGYSRSVINLMLRSQQRSIDEQTNWTGLTENIADSLLVPSDDLLTEGGVVALVGPTGVGKTTTIAKLAAKFRMIHGAGHVALVTTDNYRIAAHDQLNTYGRILDAPVRVAHDSANLTRILDDYSGKRLVLIDTAGMSQRDMRLAEQFALFRSSNRPIKSYLVMSAATEYGALCEIIKAFSIFQLHAGILTKLDETVTTGSALSALIDHKLPLAFASDGQKVPENLHIPNPRTIVKQSLGAYSGDFYPIRSSVDGYSDRRAHALS